MTQELPEPLVPTGVDLRDFGFMPLDVRRLLTSETWIEAAEDPRLGHALMSLWAEAWHQVPAGSLPDNDRVLQRLSMCPTAKEWARIRERAMAGWVKCSDGLLYHPVVAEKAIESWQKKLAQRERTAAATAAREARRRERDVQRDVPRNEERNVERNDVRDVQRDVQRESERHVHQGTGTGTGTGTGNIALTADAPPGTNGNGKAHRAKPRTACPDAFDLDDDLYDWAKEKGIPEARVVSETEKFLNHHKGKGSLQADWRATWRTWMLNSLEFRR